MPAPRNNLPVEHHHQSCDTIALLWLFLGDLERGHHGGHTCSFYCRLWKPVSPSMTRLPHMGPLQKVRGLSSSHSSSTRNEESDTNPHARLTYLCTVCLDMFALVSPGAQHARVVCSDPSRLLPLPAPAEHPWAECLLILSRAVAPSNNSAWI